MRCPNRAYWLAASITRGLDSAEQVKRLKWWLKSVTEKDDGMARRIYLVALMGSE